MRDVIRNNLMLKTDRGGLRKQIKLIVTSLDSIHSLQKKKIRKYVKPDMLIFCIELAMFMR